MVNIKKSDKAPFVIYADLEWLIKKTDGCKNNLENSFTTKAGEHLPSCFSMSTIPSFKNIKNKPDVYRCEDCTLKFCKSLREHSIMIIHLKIKKMKLLTKKQQKLYENANICYICKEKFENKYGKDKKCHKVRDHCHYTREYGGAAHSICNLNYSIHKKLPITFYNESNYNYHFIITDLTEEFEKHFPCFGESPRGLVEPRDRILVKGYGFLFFAKNMGKNVRKNVRKNISKILSS